MLPRALRTLFALALTVLVLAGCGGGNRSNERSGNVGWPQLGQRRPRTRTSPPSTRSTAATSPSCSVAWTRPGGAGPERLGDLPDRRRPHDVLRHRPDQVFAVDAATGKVRWSYTPPVDFLAGPGLELAEPVSRGVTYGAGRIYLTTGDDQLIALDAATGKVRWQTRVVDPAKGNTMNSPGTFWQGEIMVGGPAGDAGLRGFVAAYDATTGKQLWRSHMVPPPGKGWNRASGTHGGGDVWMPPIVDPQTGIAYVATGNPTPGFTNAERPGCNPFGRRHRRARREDRAGSRWSPHRGLQRLLGLRHRAGADDPRPEGRRPAPPSGRRRQQVGLLLDPRRRRPAS